MVVLPEFQKNALPVGIHQVLRRILAGKTKSFVHLYRQVVILKQLVLYFVFCFIYNFLGNQMFTGNINP